MHFEGFCFPHSNCSAAFEWDADERGWALRLTPTEPLEPGDYMLDIPIGGMFSGREYYYFRVDPAILALPPMAQDPHEITVAEAGDTAAPIAGDSSSGWLEAFPLSSALISALMALVMLRRMRHKVCPHEAGWALAFLMFAVAAASQVIGDLAGWTSTPARLYYVTGATLLVGWLGRVPTRLRKPLGKIAPPHLRKV